MSTIAAAIRDTADRAAMSLPPSQRQGMPIALAVHDFCVEVLSGFVRLHRGTSTRVRPRHSIRLEPSRLITEAFPHHPPGVPCFALAAETAADDAQAWAYAAVESGETGIVLVCVVRRLPGVGEHHVASHLVGPSSAAEARFDDTASGRASAASSGLVRIGAVEEARIHTDHEALND